MRKAPVIIVGMLLSACVAQPPQAPTRAPADHRQESLDQIKARVYGWGFDSGKRALRRDLSDQLRVSRETTAPCPLAGNGLIRDRPPTDGELRAEIDRLLDLYRWCAAEKADSDATILWLLGEIRHGD